MSSGNEGVGGVLLLVGKATVCSLADEQTSVDERGMNGETVVFRRRREAVGCCCVFLKFPVAADVVR